MVISGHHEKKCLIVSNPIEEGVKEKEKIFMFVFGKIIVNKLKKGFYKMIHIMCFE